MESQHDRPVMVTDEGAVRIIRLNRPEKKNALTHPMYAAMAHALTRPRPTTRSAVSCSPACRARFARAPTSPIFSRRRSGGSAGARSNFSTPRAFAKAAGRRGRRRRGRRRHDDAASLRLCGRAPRSDTRHAVPQARAHSRSRLDAAGAAAHGLLPRFRVLVMGRPMSAEQAKAAGIVNDVVDAAAVDDVALAAAREIAALPAGAVALSRKLLRGEPDDVAARIDIGGTPLQGAAAIGRSARRIRKHSSSAASEVGGVAFRKNVVHHRRLARYRSGHWPARGTRRCERGDRCKDQRSQSEASGTIYTAADEIERRAGRRCRSQWMSATKRP